jgi:RNA polymerase sigma-70 factor (ECF subfamily)
MTPLLAERLREDRSLQRIFRHHAGDVYRYALALLREPSDAEDVTKTTFLNAYGALRRGASPGAAQSWLIGIAHDVCRYRTGEGPRRHDDLEQDGDLGEPLEHGGLPTVGQVRQAFGELTDAERSALVLRDLEGCSCREVAAALGVTTEEAEVLVFSARRSLREGLESALTCAQAELAISRDLDGLLSAADYAALSAHLRRCGLCAELARTQRAQRAAIRALAAIPLPDSLSSIVAD